MMDWAPLVAGVAPLVFSLRHWIERSMGWSNFFTAVGFLNLGVFIERNFMS